MGPGFRIQTFGIVCKLYQEANPLSLFLIPFHFLLLSSFAFNPSTTRYELSVSASTLAHQLAHNIGIKHDESGKFLYSFVLLGKYPAS